MAFLDNSGDIILDAVLTDTGRLRLAQGDGSFKISKFALGDDEINYTLYDKNHSSGSAYNDLQVLQTPVLEAFTNNTSNLKTKLISISRTNVLFMPTLKLNQNEDQPSLLQYGYSKFFSRTISNGTGVNIPTQDRFYVACDPHTLDACRHSRASGESAHLAERGTLRGMIKGFKGGATHNDIIRVDQGLDTNEIPPSLGLDTDLFESAYIIEMDYRLGRLMAPGGTDPVAVNFIDDDNIASYYVTSDSFINTTLGAQSTSVNGQESFNKSDLAQVPITVVHEGPRGSMLQFQLRASQELQSSTYLFNQIGSSVASTSTQILGFPSSGDGFVKSTIYYIDTIIRVIGANTGYRLDIPVRYIKVA